MYFVLRKNSIIPHILSSSFFTIICKQKSHFEPQQESLKGFCHFIIISTVCVLCLQAEGKRLGLVGWVQNTDAGTVQGQLQGSASKVQMMQHWLQTIGSPQSRITKAEFKNEHTVDKLDFKDFKVVR